MGEFAVALRERGHVDGRAVNEHWLEELREVTPAEVHDAIRLGTIVNLRDDVGALVEIRDDEDYSGAFLEAPVPTARIDADTLASVIRSYSGFERGEKEFDTRGLRLRDVVIVGELFPRGGRGGLDLNGVELEFQLGFEGCVFLGSLAIERSTLPGLRFDTCMFVQAPMGLLLGRTTVDTLAMFQVEGLVQFFAPDAHLGVLDVRQIGVELPEGGRSAFRTVLGGATIGELVIDADDDPHLVMPAGHAPALRVEQVSISSSDVTHHGKAEWVAKWLSGGTPPRFPLGRWNDSGSPHDRSAWASIADAMTAAGYESARGVRYVDQGTRLRVLAERHRDSKLRFVPRMLRWLTLDLTVRYFTANLRALGGLAACWLLVSVLAWINMVELWRDSAAGATVAPPEDALAAGADGVVWALTYGLDLTISPLDLGFDAPWPTSIALLAAFAAIKLASLGLFGLFVVGLTGIIDRGRR